MPSPITRFRSFCRREADCVVWQKGNELQRSFENPPSSPWVAALDTFVPGWKGVIGTVNSNLYDQALGALGVLTTQTAISDEQRARAAAMVREAIQELERERSRAALQLLRLEVAADRVVNEIDGIKAMERSETWKALADLAAAIPSRATT